MPDRVLLLGFNTVIDPALAWYDNVLTSLYYRLAMFGFFAAAVSFGLEMGVVIGAFFSVFGSVLACSAISIIAVMKASSVSLLSVSVGSIINASLTIVGK